VPEEAREESEIEFSWAGETARHVGTVVHRWLQRMADDALRGWDAKRVESLRPRFAKELERRGVSVAELKRSAELVSAALKNALDDDRGRWVLGPHEDAQSEYRLRTRVKGASRTYIIDRVFRDKDGARWIVDYKTSRHEGADMEAFLDRERDRYAAQLRLYGAALEDSRLGLYFPLLRGWRQWEP
jgi:ATP-dependent exoDNAse (exonuclease V) beta subunit